MLTGDLPSTVVRERVMHRVQQEQQLAANHLERMFIYQRQRGINCRTTATEEIKRLSVQQCPQTRQRKQHNYSQQPARAPSGSLIQEHTTFSPPLRKCSSTQITRTKHLLGLGTQISVVQISRQRNKTPTKQRLSRRSTYVGPPTAAREINRPTP